MEQLWGNLPHLNLVQLPVLQAGPVVRGALARVLLKLEPALMQTIVGSQRANLQPHSRVQLLTVVVLTVLPNRTECTL